MTHEVSYETATRLVAFTQVKVESIMDKPDQIRMYRLIIELSLGRRLQDSEVQSHLLAFVMGGAAMLESLKPNLKMQP